MLDKETYPSAKVVDLASKMIAVKIDADKDKVTLQKYEVQALPTVTFLDSKGKKLHELVGFAPPDDFVKEMKAAIKKFTSGK